MLPEPPPFDELEDELDEEELELEELELELELLELELLELELEDELDEEELLLEPVIERTTIPAKVPLSAVAVTAIVRLVSLTVVLNAGGV